jgi:hypothetical protein
MTEFIVGLGVHVRDSDLGKRIQQLSQERPSYIVVPAIHKQGYLFARSPRPSSSRALFPLFSPPPFARNVSPSSSSVYLSFILYS